MGVAVAQAESSLRFKLHINSTVEPTQLQHGRGSMLTPLD